jgi:hypothetical protein
MRTDPRRLHGRCYNLCGTSVCTSERRAAVPLALKHRRGVAQPGRAPGSGPGGRRFKSSLPDQYFQILKLHFWFSVDSDGVEIVDGRVFPEVQLRILRTSIENPSFKSRRNSWQNSLVVRQTLVLKFHLCTFSECPHDCGARIRPDMSAQGRTREARHWRDGEVIRAER